MTLRGCHAYRTPVTRYDEPNAVCNTNAFAQTNGVPKLVRETCANSLSQDTLALILAGGSGKRLRPLTINRCKPAVPFGGCHRIIDFTLSNCINSGIHQIGVLTQYQQRPLHEHLEQSWNSLNNGDSVQVEKLPAQRCSSRQYAGTADAIAKNIAFLKRKKCRYTLILAGDHIYKADYRRLIWQHKNTGAGVSVACSDVPLQNAHQFGVVTCNAAGRIFAFEEKPSHPSANPVQPHSALVSMGVYLFDTPLLIKILELDQLNPFSSHDFGHDILPTLINRTHVQAYEFQRAQLENYWRDVGTVDAYYEASMQQLNSEPELNPFDSDWPIHPTVSTCRPARYLRDSSGHNGVATQSIVSAGCIIRGSRLRHSILSCGVQVDEQCKIDHCLILPGASIGKGCRIRNAIIDADTVIPDNTRIGFDRLVDEKNYSISDNGIVVVSRGDALLCADDVAMQLTT